MVRHGMTGAVVALALVLSAGCTARSAAVAPTSEGMASSTSVVPVGSPSEGPATLPSAPVVSETPVSASPAVASPVSASRVSASPVSASPAVLASVSSDPGDVPVCGSEVPPLKASEPTVPPPADTCSFPPDGSGSPTCPIQPTAVVSAGVTRSPASNDLVSGTPVAAFGRWGGEQGDSMCFSEYPGSEVLLSNGSQAVLLPPSVDPLRVAGQTTLARSEAVWGAVSSTVSRVELQDAARPNGVAVDLSTVGPQVRIFVAPVTAGSATITAFTANGPVQQVISVK